MTTDLLFAADHRYNKQFDIFEFIRYSVVHYNESFDIFIAGLRGIGKSTVAYGIAMLIDPNFDNDKWVFESEKYIEIITNKQRKGTVVVFDDVGTQKSGSSRKWQKEDAHDLADITQVNRTDGIITIATSLEHSRGEKRFRSGFRVIVQPIKKVTNMETHGNGMAIDVEIRVSEYDIFNNVVYRKLFRYAPGGRIKHVRLYHPPADKWKEYQRHRSDFLTAVKKKQEEKTAQNELNDKQKEMANKYGISNNPNRVKKFVMLAQELSDAGITSYKKSIPKSEMVEKICSLFGLGKTTGSTLTSGLATKGFLKSKVGGTKSKKKSSAYYWISSSGIEFLNELSK